MIKTLSIIKFSALTFSFFTPNCDVATGYFLIPTSVLTFRHMVTKYGFEILKEFDRPSTNLRKTEYI